MQKNGTQSAELETLTVEDIARILHRSVNSIHVAITRNLGGVPPSRVIPGLRRKIWLHSDVNNWLKGLPLRDQPAQPAAGGGEPVAAVAVTLDRTAPVKRGRGRPRKLQGGV